MIKKSEAKNHGVSISDGKKRQESDREELRNKLRELLPGLVNADGHVDVKALRDVVDIANSTSNDQGYELTFAGKGLARAMADSPTDYELKTECAQSKDFDNTDNVVIRGDNLDVLKILYQNYFGKIRMIYIDPPYNTKGENFVYKDDFRQSEASLIAKFGMKEETADFLHNVFGTRSHSGWLSFMYPRLKLARQLLREDGVIFISIDDNEQANLKIICDEIYGENNCIGNICWNSTKSVTNTALLSVSHNNIYIYAREIDYFIKNRRSFRLKEDEKGFSNADNDPRGAWKADPFQVGGWRPNQQYEIKNPKTGQVYKPNDGCSWKNDYDRFQELMKDNRISFGAKGESGPQRKRFLSEAKQRGKVAKSWWDDVGTTSSGTIELKNLFGGKSIFTNPKPVSLITKTIYLGCPSDGIVMDFFAGSGTTGDAIMQLNAEDGGNRKFILVQWDEKIDLEKSEAAYKFCIDNKLDPVISSITLERLNRAGEKIVGGGGGQISGHRL